MIIGQCVLQEVRQIFPNAVIAGGYVRDQEMGGEFKDIDIFFPCTPLKDVYVPYKNRQKLYLDKSQSDLVVGTKKLVQNNSNFKCENYEISRELEKYIVDSDYYGKLDLVYKDTIPVQIIGYRLSIEDFAENLVQRFSYNIDMCYYDGTDTVITKPAQTDIKQGKATLRPLKGCDLSELPKHINKFFRLQKKYPDLRFNGNAALEIKNPEYELQKSLIENRDLFTKKVLDARYHKLMDENRPPWDNF